MAITISTYTLPVGFSRADVLTQLETIFADLAYHGPGISGLISSIQSRAGGGSGLSLSDVYTAAASTTTGSGTGATFLVTRYASGKAINSITVNNPGKNYSTGDVVTIPASEIGGTANGATDVTLVVNASPTTFGSPSTYFAKDLNRNDPWAVMRQEYDETKKYGFTYRGFQIQTDNTLRVTVGSDFYPFDTDNVSDLGGNYSYSFRGVPELDIYGNVNSSDTQIIRTSGSYKQISQTSPLWATNSDPLEIIVYRSQLDPNFSIIQFRQPVISSQNLINNTFVTFSIHNYTTPLWDLDDVFMGGITIFKPYNDYPLTGNYSVGMDIQYWSSGYNAAPFAMKRMAEYGYSRMQDENPSFYDRYISTFAFQDTFAYPWVQKIYSRDSSLDTSFPGYGVSPGISPNADYRAIMKGIPLCNKIAPVPYYLPDEFVLLDFRLSTPLENIQPGNTITVSPSEVYTVISGGYATNSTSATWGILLAARTT